MRFFVFVILVAHIAAREQLKHHQADLFIMDMTLPDGNGLDLYRELKALYHLSVIFCNGYEWTE